MIIRRMLDADVDRVAGLEAEIFTSPWSKAGFLESLTKSYSYFYVAIVDEKIVGYMGIHNFGGDGEITNVAVDKEYRGRQIAFSMLSYAMEETKKEGMEAFTLEVRTSNIPAQKLYEKLGFTSQGIRKNFYQNPTEDAIIMWKN